MRKHIIIVGAGVVGTTCAQRLSQDGHDVVIVERDEETARELHDQLDVQVVSGDGCSLPALREAQIDQADLLLAVTDSDEVNMITALIAGSMFDVDQKVIRLRNRDHLENLPELARSWPGKTTAINPDRVAADRILSLVRIPEAVDVTDLLGGRVVVAGFRIDPNSPLIGKTLAELPQMFPEYKLLIPVIYRDGDALHSTGETRIASGDVAYFASVREGISSMLRALGRPVDITPRLVIGGGGDIGRMVARGAIERGYHTTLIRRSLREAERLAVELEQALVLHGDVLNESLLLEAGIEHATTFIAVTGEQETNLLSAVLAKRQGTPRAIALVDNPTYLSVADSMGINAVVSPRLASVSAILRFVRGAHFEEVASLPQEKVEVSVVELDQDSPLTDRPLHTLGLPRGVIIAAIANGDDVVIPGGADVLRPGSRAVFFTPAKQAEKLAQLLETR